MTREAPRQVAFVLAATSHGTMLVNRNDYRMHEGNAGIGVGFQLLSQGVFDADEIELARTVLLWLRDLRGNGIVALDCGANIGVHSIEWARLMTGWGEVLAIEAQERIFYALAGNICLNNLFNARAINAAVNDRDGVLEIPHPNYTLPGSFGSLELLGGAGAENIGQVISRRPEDLRRVPSIRIDGFNLQRVDFIKIDVEGMEIAALGGAAATIGRSHPVMLIEHIKTEPGALVRHLSALGYNYWVAGMNFLAVHASDPITARIAGISKPTAA